MKSILCFILGHKLNSRMSYCTAKRISRGLAFVLLCMVVPLLQYLATGSVSTL